MAVMAYLLREYSNEEIDIAKVMLMCLIHDIVEDVDFANWEIAAEIAHVYEADFGWEDEFDISEEMDDLLPRYKYAEAGEVLGGALAPTGDAAFAPAGDDKFVDPLPCTDSLMNVIAERIPKMAE